jgi:glycosyltransferase involved in cell wall biosynthesis
MRIIHVLHSKGYGGAENHALIQMQGQRAAGHQVAFAGLADSWLGRACKAAHIEVFNLRMAGIYDLWSMFKLQRIAKTWQADILHGHLIRGSHYVGRAGHMDRKPLAIGTAHATTARTHMQHCAHIIAVSGAVKTQLLQHGYPDSRVSVIWNGMPEGPVCADREALRAELGIAPGQHALVNAGRFIHDKGQDLLVQMMAKLPQPHVHLYLVGDASTDHGQAIQASAKADARIHFLGYRNDVQRILPAFDGYVLSSRREAMPLSLIEAMAARLPIVTTSVGGVPEVVQDGVSGLIVPPDDAPALTQAVARQLAHPDAARAMADAGHAHYLAHLTADTMVAHTLALYQGLQRSPS